MSPEFDQPSPLDDSHHLNGGIPDYDRRFAIIYDLMLVKESLRDGSIVIKISDIDESQEEERLILLENKLNEYTERFERRLERFFYDQENEKLIRSMASSNYKRVGVKILLERGELNTWALSNALSVIDGGAVLMKEFDNAMGVIHDYVKTGGQNVTHR